MAQVLKEKIKEAIKKDNRAWARLVVLGEKIARTWQGQKSAVELIQSARK